MLRLKARERIVQNPADNIVAVLVGPDGQIKQRRQWFFGRNLVTNTGDQYYAEAAVAAGSVMTVAGMRLGTTNSAPAKGDTDVGGAIGSVAIDSGYPRTGDNDADNTGAGDDIVTWRSSFGTGIANVAGIVEVAIVDSLTSPTAALMRGTLASFTKTENDTLKMFVNHTMNGV